MNVSVWRGQHGVVSYLTDAEGWPNRVQNLKTGKNCPHCDP